MSTAVADLLQQPVEDVEELLCRADLGVWTERKIGLEMAPLHWEWCSLRMHSRRLAVIAPREHSKSETFTVNGTAWESIYNPGLWTYVFAQTGDQSKAMLERIIAAVGVAAPWMVDGMVSQNKQHCVFANYARVDVAGSGKAVRGAHPDRIIGDDVLEEGSAGTSLQRKRVERWWFGTIGGMSHPQTTRAVGPRGREKVMPFGSTKVFLVGTPFHQQDLLMGMKENPVYEFRRYAAEFDPGDLVDGLAVEVG